MTWGCCKLYCQTLVFVCYPRYSNEIAIYVFLKASCSILVGLCLLFKSTKNGPAILHTRARFFLCIWPSLQMRTCAQWVRAHYQRRTQYIELSWRWLCYTAPSDHQWMHVLLSLPAHVRLETPTCPSSTSMQALSFSSFDGSFQAVARVLLGTSPLSCFLERIR